MLRTIDKILMVIADGKRFGGRLCGRGLTRGGYLEQVRVMRGRSVPIRLNKSARAPANAPVSTLPTNANKVIGRRLHGCALVRRHLATFIPTNRHSRRAAFLRASIAELRPLVFCATCGVTCHRAQLIRRSLLRRRPCRHPA